MLNDIRAQLFNEAQRLRRREKLQSMLDSLLPDFWALQRKRRQLQEELLKEELDYEELKELGLANIVCRILGNLEQRVEKERQEAAAALLKLTQCENEIGKMKERIDELESECKSLDDALKKHKNLPEEKERLLRQENNPTVPKLLDLDKELELHKSRLRELDEARDAGRSAIYALLSVGEKLKSAESWGLWDCFGGGLFSAFLKYDCLDKANVEAGIAEGKLNRFKSELADIEISKNITIEIGMLWKFADFFFDGIISDLIVQSKISNSRECLGETIRQTRNVLKQLERMRKTEEYSLRALEEKYKQAVEEA